MGEIFSSTQILISSGRWAVDQFKPICLRRVGLRNPAAVNISMRSVLIKLVNLYGAHQIQAHFLREIDQKTTLKKYIYISK